MISLLLASGTYLTAQEDTIAAPENIVTDGVPKIPASLAGAIERYTENRTAVQTDWHPKRREMIIATRFGNTLQAHLVEMPGGARQQLTFFPEPVHDASFHPKGGDDYMLFRKDVGGGEWYQYFRYDLANRREHPVDGWKIA